MPMKTKDFIKNAGNICFKAFTWLLVAFTICVVLFTTLSLTTVNKNDASVLSFKFYIVQTDSMSKSENNKDLDVHFKAGDIVIIKSLTQTEKQSLKSGNVITFRSKNPDSYGLTITHMIREVKKDANGNVTGFVTFGTNTGANDAVVVTPEYVLGKYVGQIPNMGNFFSFVRSPSGYVVFIFLPLLILIFYHAINVIRLFGKYKREQAALIETERAEQAALLKAAREEQAALINAERKQLAEERKANAELLLELRALKQQLATQTQTTYKSELQALKERLTK